MKLLISVRSCDGDTNRELTKVISAILLQDKIPLMSDNKPWTFQNIIARDTFKESFLSRAKYSSVEARSKVWVKEP